jgi:hypothetical protein
MIQIFDMVGTQQQFINLIILLVGFPLTVLLFAEIIEHKTNK